MVYRTQSRNDKEHHIIILLNCLKDDTTILSLRSYSSMNCISVFARSMPLGLVTMAREYYFQSTLYRSMTLLF